MKIGGIILCTLALATWSIAADEPSVKKGKELYYHAALGAAGKNCAGCHPGGKGLEWAVGLDEAQLAGSVNHCLTSHLHERELTPGSSEMKSLLMYISTLALPHESRES